MRNGNQAEHPQNPAQKEGIGFPILRGASLISLLDHTLYTATWIGSVYLSCWPEKLDIRSIKYLLRMDVIRAKTPAMVRTEFWSRLLAYNLILAKMLQ